MTGVLERRRFALVARATLSAVALLPVLPAALRRVPALSKLALPLDAWFRLQCERDPARTLHWFGVALPVCARCTGIYAGFGLGALLAFPRLNARTLRAWLLAACTLMLSDVLSEAWGLRPESASLRVVTGFLLSYPVGLAFALRLTDRTRDRATAGSRSPNSAASPSS